MNAPAPIRRPLEMWTIYDHPSDAPDTFIARKWLIFAEGTAPTDQTMCEQDIEDLRKYLRAAGWHCLGRNQGDDPKIVESWV